ncbi:phosphotransferase [Modestobacter sp. VKM Ac-2986]|uniref:phosphotransferase n=1 Tax=Modestobacter sp. VKM Ac-2986 TaxID=3004140 RepID=UPI0022AB6E8C|nr:phosphotransferase [Modestobacter sp. VKM Ac-2986]MCZ2830664.1 phosphotransferase [Modestobacter sp. VKM Ac-2986]
MEDVRRQRARASLRRFAPQLAGTAIVELGSGLDNTAFLVGDLVLRVGEGRSVGREARLLRVLAPRVSIAVPAPRFVDEEAGVLAHPMLPGRSLLGRRPPAGAAPALGRFLRELHDTDLDDVADLVPTDAADPHEWLEDLVGPPDLLAVLRRSVPPPTRQRVLVHADLGAEHVLEHDEVVSGVIDWSDAALSDPALDFARLYRDFGPAFLARVVEAYGGLDAPGSAMARITFFARCAALEDLAYGRDSGRDEYRRAAEQALRWLFHRSP